MKARRRNSATARSAHGMDFADALHLARSGHYSAFETFDRKLAKSAKALGTIAVDAPDFATGCYRSYCQTDPSWSPSQFGGVHKGIRLRVPVALLNSCPVMDALSPRKLASMVKPERERDGMFSSL